MNVSFAKKNLVLFLVFIMILFALTAGIVLRIQGANFYELEIFVSTQRYTVVQYILECLIFVSAIIVIFFIPGLLWVGGWHRKKTDLFHLMFYAFLVSVGGLILLTSLYKMVSPYPLNKLSLVCLLAALIFTGLPFFHRNNELQIEDVQLDSRLFLVLIIVFLSLFYFIWIFKNKVLWTPFDHNYAQQHVLSIPLGAQSDIHEAFGRIVSLKKHLWPFWDLEYVDKFGYFVVDPPLFHFLALFLVTLFGDAFAVLSMANILLIPLNIFIVLKISLDNRKEQRPSAGLMAALAVVAFVYLLKLLRHPYAYDDAITDLSFLMTTFMLMQFFFLLNKKYLMFVVCALSAFLTQYESAFFTIMGAILYWLYYPDERRMIGGMFVIYLGSLGVYGLFIFILGVATGDLFIYIESILIEKLTRFDLFHILDHCYPVGTEGWSPFSISNSVLFFITFMTATLGTGLTLFLKKRDKIAQLFSFLGISYLFLVLISRYNRLHYVTPLVFISMIVAIRAFIEYRHDGKWQKYFCLFKTNQESL